MEQKKIDRINELAKKAKSEGLSKQEIIEREALRNEYRASILGNLCASLDNCVIVDENGNRIPVKRKNIH